MLSRLLSLIAFGLGLHASGARAQFSVCNDTEIEVFVALAAPTDSLATPSDSAAGDGWTSSGWFALGPFVCGDLVAELRYRYYYLYAETTRFRTSVRLGDREVWGYSSDRPLIAGDFPFCVSPADAFAITDQAGCEADGFQRVGFREIDVGAHASFVLTLGAAP